jgi:hypothetical protein
MARKYSAKKRMSKIEPAQLTLTFATASIPAGPTVSNYIDLSQVASLVNRRFYRQGINWAVAGMKLITPAGFVGQVAVNKLPNTWVMSNAWEKGFRAWQRMNKEAMEEAASVRPRFLDFKVYADFKHAQLGVNANLLPVSVGDHLVASLATAGEWKMSTYNVPDPTAASYGVYEREIIATGLSYPGSGASGINSVSLIEGYAASRGLPNVLDPNVPDDAADADGVTPENWMSALFNDGTEQDADTLEDLITENNIAPYPFENDGVNTDTMYPGGANQLVGMQIHTIQNVTGTTIGGTTRIKGGNFPCGLINIDATNTGTTGNLVIEIDLVPGNHRGYLCEPMTEM